MSRLLERTIELIKESDIPVTKMAKNAECSVHLIHRLKSGQKHSPSVVTCEKLYEYLSHKKLEL